MSIWKNWQSMLISTSMVTPPKSSAYVHPFTSAKVTLVIFNKMKIITLKNDEEQQLFSNLLKLIEDSHQPVENVYPEQANRENVCKKVHSHHNL